MIEGNPYLAARIEYGGGIIPNLPTVARDVATILMRPCFAAAGQLSAWRSERLVLPAKPTAERIVGYLSHPANEGIVLGAPGNPCVEILNGNERARDRLRATSLRAYVVFPLEQKTQEELLRSVCDLARALRAAAGFVAIENRYHQAFQLAVPGSIRPRAGLSEQRLNERAARGRNAERLGTELAGVEWGTFLGPGHLERIDLDAVRASGAFAGVLRLSDDLAYLQVTHDPMDDVTGVLEAKLPAARRVLAPVRMDISAGSLSELERD